MPHKPNPKLFRELSDPFNTRKEAADAMEAFREGIEKLREECRLPQIYVIASCSAIMDGGNEGELILTFSMGDVMKDVHVTAYAYGREKLKNESLIASILKGDD